MDCTLQPCSWEEQETPSLILEAPKRLHVFQAHFHALCVNVFQRSCLVEEAGEDAIAGRANLLDGASLNFPQLVSCGFSLKALSQEGAAI